MTLLYVAAAWTAGAALGLGLAPPWGSAALLAAAGSLLAATLVALRRGALPGLLLAAAAVGVLRALAPGAESDLARYHGAEIVAVEGVVVADPERSGAVTRVRLRVESVERGGVHEKVSGDLLAALGGLPETDLARQDLRPRYGDRLRLRGILAPPAALEDFDYPAYLARQGISSVMGFPQATIVGEGGGSPLQRWLSSARGRLAASLAASVPEPQASVGQALLLGLRDGLSDELRDTYQRAGASHLLAISGLHVGVLMGLTLAVSEALLGRRRQLHLIPPLAAIWLYVAVAGMSPSATRAAIMGSVYLAAHALGRPRSALPALGLAAAAMVAFDPRVLWSVSFQLSFAAMAGITLWAEPLTSLLSPPWSRQPDVARASVGGLKPFAGGAAMTVAATAATLPLVAFHFQRVSLVGLPATLLALPALPAVLVSQTSAALVGLVSPALAAPFAWLAWLTTGYVNAVVGVLARLPLASVETGPLAPPLVAAYYGALLSATALASSRSFRQGRVRDAVAAASWVVGPLRRPGRATGWWALALVASVAALLWTAALSLPDGRLHVAFLDVGQGDAALITTPSGRQVLVDGGPDPLALVRALDARMPFRDRTLDLVVLTHPHQDHVAGLVEALRRYQVAAVLERRTDYDTPEYRAWASAVEEEGATEFVAEAGQVLVLGDGVTLEVLSPGGRLLKGTTSDVDNASVVLRLAYGGVRFLLAGDAFAEAEAALVASGVPLDSEVLKVGHHGSRSSSSPGFLDAVAPRAAVIPAGADNRFGHPHEETLQALGERLAPSAIFVTRDRGTIEFATDGALLYARTDR